MTTEDKRIAARRYARRQAALKAGRNPVLVTSEVRSLARITIPVLRLFVPDEPACTPDDAELFFSPVPADRQLALAICASCPERLRCLASAVERDEEFGIFGGHDFEERQEAIAS